LVSRGRLVTTHNFYELFNGILNPKQLEGLRLLLTPFPQQQFNLTADRRGEHPSLGVAERGHALNRSLTGELHVDQECRPDSDFSRSSRVEGAPAARDRSPALRVTMPRCRPHRGRSEIRAARGWYDPVAGACDSPGD